MKIISIGPDRVEEFVSVARMVHADDPSWIPPLTQQVVRELSGQGTSAAHLRHSLFLCKLGGKLVGRVGAFLTPRLTAADGRPVGQVGHFEIINNFDVAAALLDAACAWLAREGAGEAWGPMSGGAHRPHRFMTAGFERTPFLFEPRNPPWYPEFFERCGFREMHVWDSYELSAAALCERLSHEWQVERKAARARRRFHLSFPTREDVAATLARIHILLDAAWAEHVGYVALDRAEFEEVFAGVLAIVPDEYLALLQRHAGDDAGLAFMYPDYADAVRSLNGDARGWGAWRDDPLPRRVVLHTTALAPAARGGGAMFLFLEHAAKLIQKDGYQDAIIALVDRTARIHYTFAEPTRRYALYARSLAEGSPLTSTVPLPPSI